jgi:hypothetical protein
MTGGQAAGSGASSPTGQAHPGVIEFEDHVEGRTWTERADATPQRIAWVEEELGQWAPVTRIVTEGSPGRLEIKRFGSDGSLLDVTMQRPGR